MPLDQQLQKRYSRVLPCSLAPLPVRGHGHTHGVDVARNRERGHRCLLV